MERWMLNISKSVRLDTYIYWRGSRGHINRSEGTPKEMAADLADGVAKISVDASSPAGYSPAPHTGKVSGLDSFMGSSDNSADMLAKTIEEIKDERGVQPPISILDRTKRSRGGKERHGFEKGVYTKGPSDALKDIGKKSMKIMKSSIADSIRELEKKGVRIDELRAVNAEGSPAKCGKTTPTQEMNLMGSHDEARQEQ
jgi:hypothetical protein